MKDLLEYLQKKNIYPSLLDNIILPHIAIDLNSFVNEYMGIFPGLEELTDKIATDIANKIKQIRKKLISHNELQNDSTEALLKHIQENLEVWTFTLEYEEAFKDTFFSNLYVNFKFGEEYGFSNKIDEINPSTGLLDEIVIDISIDTSKCAKLNFRDLFIKIKNRISGIAAHELLHAYQYYKILYSHYIESNGFEYEYSGAEFNKFYRKICAETDDNLKHLVRKALYLTTQSEQSAFVAQLAIELKAYKKTHSVTSPKDALEIFKQTEIYSSYNILYGLIKLYNNNSLFKEHIDIITDEYNTICGTHWEPSKVFKKLEFLLKKSLHKLNQIIGKLCLENLDIEQYRFENPKLFLRILENESILSL